MALKSVQLKMSRARAKNTIVNNPMSMASNMARETILPGWLISSAMCVTLSIAPNRIAGLLAQLA